MYSWSKTLLLRIGATRNLKIVKETDGDVELRTCCN